MIWVWLLVSAIVMMGLMWLHRDRYSFSLGSLLVGTVIVAVSPVLLVGWLVMSVANRVVIIKKKDEQ